MLKVIFFYIFGWWFAPLNSRRQLEVRIGLSALLLFVCLSAGVTVLLTEALKDNGVPLYAIIPFVMVVIIGIRMAKDDMSLNSDELIAQEQAQQSIEAERIQVEKEKQTNSKYEKLIEECGIKFFIKYYKQVKALPIRDVVVSEDYPFAEKQERLLAVKGIIDLDLVEYTLNKIIDTYSEVLESSYIEKAKALLSECRGEIKQEEEPEIDDSESEEYTTTISVPEHEDNWDN